MAHLRLQKWYPLTENLKNKKLREKIVNKTSGKFYFFSKNGFDKLRSAENPKVAELEFIIKCKVYFP